MHLQSILNADTGLSSLLFRFLSVWKQKAPLLPLSITGFVLTATFNLPSQHQCLQHLETFHYLSDPQLCPHLFPCRTAHGLSPFHRHMRDFACVPRSCQPGLSGWLEVPLPSKEIPFLKLCFPIIFPFWKMKCLNKCKEVTFELVRGFPRARSSAGPCYGPALSCHSLCLVHSPLHCAIASPKTSL